MVSFCFLVRNFNRFFLFFYFRKSYMINYIVRCIVFSSKLLFLIFLLVSSLKNIVWSKAFTNVWMSVCFHILSHSWFLSQGYKWIRQWPINWNTSPMMIHKITPSEDYISGWNVWTLTNDSTNHNSIKVQKIFELTNMKKKI